ncbi:MAG TPA: hypothetical protein VI455_04510 [Terriglobia bacterium]
MACGRYFGHRSVASASGGICDVKERVCRGLAAVCLVALLVVMCDRPAQASNPLGTVTIDYPSGGNPPPATWGPLDSNGCPSTVNGSTYRVTWAPMTNCYHAVISCPSEKIPDIGATYGVALANALAPVNGTIVFAPSTDRGEKVSAQYLSGSLLYSAYNQGFMTISFAWDGAWGGHGSVGTIPVDITSTLWPHGGSYKLAGCRPGTLLNYFYTQYYQNAKNNSPAAGMCAQGASGGAGQIANALTFYGAGAYLDKVSLGAGVNLTDLVKGCEVPYSNGSLTDVPYDNICPAGTFGCNPSVATWTGIEAYTGEESRLLTFTGYNGCAVAGQPTSTTANSHWASMSLTDSLYGYRDGTASYPQTAISAWLCDNDDAASKNPSAAQAWMFLSQITFSSQIAQGCVNQHVAGSTTDPAYYDSQGDCLAVTRAEFCPGPETYGQGYVFDASDGNFDITGSAAEQADFLDPVNGCTKRH